VYPLFPNRSIITCLCPFSLPNLKVRAFGYIIINSRDSGALFLTQKIPPPRRAHLLGFFEGVSPVEQQDIFVASA
jgi:hypothetical protein